MTWPTNATMWLSHSKIQGQTDRISHELLLLSSKQKKEKIVSICRRCKGLRKLQCDFGMGATELQMFAGRSQQTSELTILSQICLLLPFHLPFLLFLLERKQQGMMLWERCQYSAPAEKWKKKIFKKMCWSWSCWILCWILLTLCRGIKQHLPSLPK